MGLCSPQIWYSSVHTILVCYSVGFYAVLLYMQLGFSIHVKLRDVRTSEFKKMKNWKILKSLNTMQ